jgi:hypothetical protein
MVVSNHSRPKYLSRRWHPVADRGGRDLTWNRRYQLVGDGGFEPRPAEVSFPPLAPGRRPWGS